jgi:aldose 1-epimerase
MQKTVDHSLDCVASLFGNTHDGEAVECVKLTNSQGIEIALLNLGARIHRIRTPDQRGQLQDIVLYCENVEHYQVQRAYLGATVGRYANRIGNSEFNVDGICYRLTANEGRHQLHGGPDGFDKRIWSMQYGTDADSAYVRFQLVSPDGDQGYPGKLTADVVYRLFNDNRLSIDIRAVTSKTTVVNISNHAYFNLSGILSGDLSGHYFTIPSSRVCAVDEELIPTGEINNVQGSVLDLKYPCNVQRLLQELPSELESFQGFDHNYIFENGSGMGLRATVFHTPSGRKLSVYSTQPGLQFYTANHLAQAHAIGPDGQAYARYGGFCLEPHHFPDSPNQPGFPSTRLQPGQTYHQQIVYQFSLV